MGVTEFHAEILERLRGLSKKSRITFALALFIVLISFDFLYGVYQDIVAEFVITRFSLISSLTPGKLFFVGLLFIMSITTAYFLFLKKPMEDGSTKKRTRSRSYPTFIGSLSVTTRVLTVVGTILVTLVVSMSVVLGSGKPNTAQKTPTPSPETRDPTGEYPMCVYEYGEWPCHDLVRDTKPRDTIYSIVIRNFNPPGDLIPFYADQICNANEEYLLGQFISKVPPQDRKIWGHDPCNFLKPGNILVIPIPQPILIQATNTP